MSILMSHMMVTKNPQNVHRNYFWAILLTFIFDIKIDINICEPHYVNFFFLWTSSIVCMFDFLIFDIFLTTWHLFDILTHQLNLNHLSPHRAIFYLWLLFLFILWTNKREIGSLFSRQGIYQPAYELVSYSAAVSIIENYIICGKKQSSFYGGAYISLTFNIGQVLPTRVYFYSRSNVAKDGWHFMRDREMFIPDFRAIIL